MLSYDKRKTQSYLNLIDTLLEPTDTHLAYSNFLKRRHERQHVLCSSAHMPHATVLESKAYYAGSAKMNSHAWQDLCTCRATAHIRLSAMHMPTNACFGVSRTQ